VAGHQQFVATSSSAWRRNVDRECEPEGAALAGAAFDADLAAMGLHGQFAERQSQARRELARLNLGKAFEYLGMILRRNAGAVVFHAHSDLAIRLFQAHTDIAVRPVYT